jgi:transaldolase / glucose-6-phosphate isomerase
LAEDSHSRLAVERQNATTPEQKYTCGGVKAAQAPGDFQGLAERGRGALRVHLASDVNAGLETLRAAVQKALA